MGIKLAKALGNDVMAISTSFSKEAMAKEKGATMFACSKDPESMKANAGKCDLILNTVSADHDINTYLPLLAKGGSTIVQLGVVPRPHSVSQFALMVILLFCVLVHSEIIFHNLNLPLFVKQ